MKNRFAFLLLFISIKQVNGFELQNNKGAENMAAANTFLFQKNCFSSVQSAFLIPHLKDKEIGLSFQNSYFLKDVNSFLISAAVPFRKNFGLGISTSYFGNNTYQLYQSNVSLAMKTNSNFSFHLGSNFNFLNVVNYGNTNQITVQGGLCYKFNSKFELAISTYNPFENKLEYRQQVEFNSLSSHSLGLFYKPNKNIDLITEINHFDNNNDFKAAIVYKVNQNFKLMTGVTTLSPSFNFGMTYQFKKFNFSFASQTNQRIGLSNNLSLCYKF